jgi:hypothetical protein
LFRLPGALSWTFTFEDQPLFAGLRALATSGIDKPVLNTFRMFAKMRGRRLAVKSSHGYTLDEIMGHGRRERSESDVHALASLDGNKLAALVWHYHADDVPGAPAAVELTFVGLRPESADDVPGAPAVAGRPSASSFPGKAYPWLCYSVARTSRRVSDSLCVACRGLYRQVQVGVGRLS